jgi:hypothetical protein
MQHEPLAPSVGWPAVDYDGWAATCDTLHAHTQLVGKLAAALAPPQPQLQHAALRLTARGWETALLPAPDGSGSLVVALDLHAHDVVLEHADGRQRRVPLVSNRAVADVTQNVLAAIDELVGPVAISTSPQETPWTTPLDEDREHATYDPSQVARYLGAATRAALVLDDFHAPYRGRATPVNAWWGSFDLAVSLFSGRSVEAPSAGFIRRNSADAEEIAVGWWPGDARYPRAAFYAYAYPSPPGLETTPVSPGRWEPALGEFILDWDDARATVDPHRSALNFLESFALPACHACSWDPALQASLRGTPPPVS